MTQHLVFNAKFIIRALDVFRNQRHQRLYSRAKGSPLSKVQEAGPKYSRIIFNFGQKLLR